MSWLHLNVEQHFQHYQSTPRSQTSTKISSKMISAHFNFPWQSTLVLPPSTIRLANDYSSRGCGASKERWCCGTHFPGVFLECTASRGKPFFISDCRKTHNSLHLFHAGESHSFQPRPSAVGLLRRCPTEKLWTFLRTFISLSFSLFPLFFSPPPLSCSTLTGAVKLKTNYV